MRYLLDHPDIVWQRTLEHLQLVGMAILIAALATRSSRRAQASTAAVFERRAGRRLAITFGSPVLTDGVRARLAFAARTCQSGASVGAGVPYRPGS